MEMSMDDAPLNDVSPEMAPESPGEEQVEPKGLDADVILDTLIPSSIDWRGTVRKHPVGSVLAVGVAGYLLGRTRGSSIVAGLAAGLSSVITRQLADVFEGEFFEFE